MSQDEIISRISYLKAQNAEIISQGFFTLNRQISDNLKEIEELQKSCAHSFKDGKCIYCEKETD